ncbi:flavodoxin [Rugamonas sp. FT107W]|uniref:Flavodoxin n=1 Tax=Duganella vulcania TaxID=2692166 RepID=A0A845HJ68_9BURK|nr:flavodoxin [Duganella vulcania]MYN18407.1 flavodoxin [Duganella vulcania]
MKPVLIVYYSRTGVTAKVATALAQACGADLERIQDLRPRTGVTGFLRSAWQALRGTPADIAPAGHNPVNYAFVVLGTPVWAGRMSAPMRSYILQQRAQFRRVGLFCTLGGSGGQHVLSAMANLCNKLPVASVCLRQKDVLSNNHLDALTSYAAELAVLRDSELQSEAEAKPS